MTFSKRKIVLFIGIISSISLVLQLSQVDFSIPLDSDPMSFTLYAIDYSHGDLTLTPKQQPGWPLLISLPFHLLDSNRFIDYENVARILSIIMTTATIPLMYLVARKFFNEKFALVSSCLYAFEPHITRWSGLGYAEPLYNIVLLGAFYFILHKNTRFVYLSFLFAGMVWWIRPNGIITIFAISLIYLINFRKMENQIVKFVAGLAIFLVVISPIMIQRYLEYGDPFYTYFAQNLFVEQYAELGAKGGVATDQGNIINYIKNYGILEFVNRFVIHSSYSILVGIAKLAVPYLIILAPFGMLFSLRPIDTEKKHILANWIFFISIVIFLAIPYSVISERRFLFSLIPFLVIFATIPIQRVVTYGLSTFSYSTHQKNSFLIIVVAIILLMGGLFLLRYEKPDKAEVLEKIEFAKFLESNLKGKILDGGYTIQYLEYVKLTNPTDAFKSYKISKDRSNEFPYTTGNVTKINLYGESLESMISSGEEHGLRYIAINEKGSVFYKYLDDVYKNEWKYPHLVKIFDSQERGLQKFRVKVFEIDYKKFHEQLAKQ